jgi:hypothetical protein
MCHNRTHASQQGDLFNHLVGAAEQRDRDRDSQRLGRLYVDGQYRFGRLHHRHIRRLLAFENAAGVALPISSFSFVSFSVSLVTFAASASVGSCRSAVSGWLR